MKKIEYYLEKELDNFWDILKIVILLIIFKFAYAFILTWVYPHPTSCIHSDGGTSYTEIILVILIAPIIEEYVFRYPLYWIYNASYSITLTLVVAVASSIVFGVLHGCSWHILLQGIAGLLYSLLFLKAGGMHDEPGRGIRTTIFAHGCFNASCMFLGTIF